MGNRTHPVVQGVAACLQTYPLAVSELHASEAHHKVFQLLSMGQAGSKEESYDVHLSVDLSDVY